MSSYWIGGMKLLWYLGSNKCDTVSVELFWEFWESCLWCIWTPSNSISQCTGNQMLNAVDLTKHLRMRRHRNFVSVGSACRKRPQNRFVPVYKHCIFVGRRLTLIICICIKMLLEFWITSPIFIKFGIILWHSNFYF